MKIAKKLLSLFLAALLLVLPFAVGAQAAIKSRYIIHNPYASVDFNSWKPYKAQLHCHTNASDGYLTVEEVVQKHYDYGFNILAITDHGTINRGWNNEPQLVPIILKAVRENGFERGGDQSDPHQNP